MLQSDTAPIVRRPLRASIDAKCFECTVDPLARGHKREQVACCINAACGLHPVRPVPRDCMAGGEIDREKVRLLRLRLGD